jgi:flagellar motor switch protein FliM
MAEILTQNEIDALLAALSTGTIDVEEVKSEEQRRKVKTYDFRRPNKFSKDQVRTLVMLHENFARLLSTSLSTYLRTVVRAEVASVDQLTYEEFTKSLQNPTIMNILSMKPLEGNVVFEFSPNLAFAMIDRLLGGDGNSTERPRELTDIEQTVIKRVVQKTFGNIKEAWSVVAELNPSFEGVEMNPLFTQIVPPTDMVILITIEVRVSDSRGLMNICFPFAVLEPLLDHLNAQFWFASSKKASTEASLAALQNRISKARVQLNVELGTTVISVNELLNLSRGDVIQLDKSIKEPMKVRVGNSNKFLAFPGLSGSRLAIQIHRVLQEGGE